MRRQALRVVRPALAVGLMLAGGAAGATVVPQEDAELRARQLEVFEDLLTRTVQEHLQASVEEGIEQERTGDLDGDGEPDGPAEDPVVVRVGRAASAHGLYIAGYGVLFSIQQPQISVLPRSFALYLNQPEGSLRVRSEIPGEIHASGATGLLRLQAEQLQRQLGQMERLLQIQMARDPESGEVQAITGRIEGLRSSLAEVRVQFEQLQASLHPETPRAETPAMAPPATRPESAEPTESERRVQVEVVEPFRLFREMADRQRSIGDILERNFQRMRQAVSDAAIDTLAHYGAVIKGLNDDDRLSVLVLPPTPMGLVRLENAGGDVPESQEYVISVRYRDIRDYDDQKIDLAEFRDRVRIHDRLGLQIVHEEPDRD